MFFLWRFEYIVFTLSFRLATELPMYDSDNGINDRGINYNFIVWSVLKKIIQIPILSSVAFFAVWCKETDTHHL